MLDNNVKDKIIKYLNNYNVKKITVFGSYARNENNAQSDLDLIVEFFKTPSLIKLCKIERELSDLIGIKVDLLTEKSINPYIAGNIKNQRKTILTN